MLLTCSLRVLSARAWLCRRVTNFRRSQQEVDEDCPEKVFVFAGFERHSEIQVAQPRFMPLEVLEHCDTWYDHERDGPLVLRREDQRRVLAALARVVGMRMPGTPTRDLGRVLRVTFPDELVLPVVRGKSGDESVLREPELLDCVRGRTLLSIIVGLSRKYCGCESFADEKREHTLAMVVPLVEAADDEGEVLVSGRARRGVGFTSRVREGSIHPRVTLGRRTYAALTTHMWETDLVLLPRSADERGLSERERMVAYRQVKESLRRLLAP